MTPTHEEIAGGRRGDGTGRLGSAMNASTQAALGCNMAWKRSYPAVIEQKECLPIPRSTIDSSQRPTAVVGWKPSGKSRMIRQTPFSEGDSDGERQQPSTQEHQEAEEAQGPQRQEVGSGLWACP